MYVRRICKGSSAGRKIEVGAVKLMARVVIRREAKSEVVATRNEVVNVAVSGDSIMKGDKKDKIHAER
jgi:hypothetical protein